MIACALCFNSGYIIYVQIGLNRVVRVPVHQDIPGPILKFVIFEACSCSLGKEVIKFV